MLQNCRWSWVTIWSSISNASSCLVLGAFSVSWQWHWPTVGREHVAFREVSFFTSLESNVLEIVVKLKRILKFLMTLKCPWKASNCCTRAGTIPSAKGSGVLMICSDSYSFYDFQLRCHFPLWEVLEGLPKTQILLFSFFSFFSSFSAIFIL